LVPIGGAFLGFVWPAIQAWLAERTAVGARALNRNIGLFNMSWSSGLLLGPLLAGILWRDHLPKYPFFFCAGIGLVMVLVLLSTRGGGSGVHREPGASSGHTADVAPRLWRALLWIAWLGNFVSWYAGAARQTMFPKLGLSNELAMTHFSVSVVLFCYWGALFAVFFLARMTQRWQYRLWPLLAAEAVGIIGMLGAGLVADTPWQFGLCFALSGAAGGLTYVSSLFYSINGPAENCGRRTAWHEGILGSGGLLGGLLSGEIAMFYGNLRAPYVGVAIMIAIIMVTQMGVWLRCAPRSSACVELAETTEGDINQ
jgi:MFS family permease